MVSFNRQQIDAYNQVAREAYKSPEISGKDYGRETIFNSLRGLLYELNPNSDYLNDLSLASAFVQGYGGGSPVIDVKSPVIQGTIERQILIPFFEEYKRAGSVSLSKLERWMALWYRDRDAELRENLPKYLASAKVLPADQKAELLAGLEYNQIAYLTGIIRRMSDLLKAKYPEKATEMDVIYNQVSKEKKDLYQFAKDELRELVSEEAQGEPLDTPEKLTLARTVAAYLAQLSAIGEYRSLVAYELTKGDYDENKLNAWEKNFRATLKDHYLTIPLVAPAQYGVPDTKEQLAESASKLYNIITEDLNLRGHYAASLSPLSPSQKEMGSHQYVIPLSKNEEEIIKDIHQKTDTGQYITVADKEQAYDTIKSIMDKHIAAPAPPAPPAPFPKLAETKSSNVADEFKKWMNIMINLPALSAEEHYLYYNVLQEYEKKGMSTDMMQDWINGAKDLARRVGYTEPSYSDVFNTLPTTFSVSKLK